MFTKAIDSLQEIIVGGLRCKIVQAPEPETLKWDHLQYSKLNRRVRSTAIIVVTVLMLLAGVVAIMKSNGRKEGMVYLQDCRFVVGPESEDINVSTQAICITI